jgi:hypothetical protein
LNSFGSYSSVLKRLIFFYRRNAWIVSCAQESEYRCYKPDPAAEEDDGLYYTGSAGCDDDYSELSWFSAGVRVGVGISLGICLGVGVSAGLLARSYQSTSRTLTRRLISKLLWTGDNFTSLQRRNPNNPACQSCFASLNVSIVCVCV